jgi:hypothetical protein
MHAYALVYMVEWLGGGLCYLYELLTLFSRTIYAITQKKKTEPQFMSCVPRGGWVLDREFD